LAILYSTILLGRNMMVVNIYIGHGKSRGIALLRYYIYYAIVDAANTSSSRALMLKLGNEYASDKSVLRDYRRFGQIWPILLLMN